MNKKLPKRQRLFVIEYQKDWNATQAAARAGYKGKNLQVVACRLVNKSQVKDEIQRQIDERLEREGVRADLILQEIARIGFSDVRKIFNDDGTLKNPKDWDDKTATAIAGLETFEEFAGRGEDRALIGHTKKVKTYDKVKALELLAKHKKLLGEPTSLKFGGVLDTGEEVSFSNMELAARLVYLIEVAVKRKEESKPKEDGSVSSQKNSRAIQNS